MNIYIVREAMLGCYILLSIFSTHEIMFRVINIAGTSLAFRNICCLMKVI